MIENQHFSDLKIMFKLFKITKQSLEMLQQKLKQYVVSKGESIMKQENFIISLLDHRDQMSELLTQSFNSEYTMDTCVNDGFY